MVVSSDPKAVLEASQTVAVVGCSTDPGKAAHRIPATLQRHGFTVWPVNPSATTILGQPCVPTLADLPAAPDLVVVFRPAAEAADVTRQAVQAGAGAVWLQLGIVSESAGRLAAAAGIDYVQNRCTAVDVGAFGIRKDAS